MSRWASLTLTTSFPEGPDDPSGHFVLSEVRRRARLGGEHRVIAPGPRGVEVRAEGEGSVEIERLGFERAFGWPGVLARVTESPALALPASAFVRAMRARVRAVDADVLVAHWLLPCGFLALEDGRPSTSWAHGSDVRLLLRSRALVRGFAELLVRRPARVVFVAEHLRDALQDALPSSLGRRVRERSAVETAPIDLDPALGREEERVARGPANELLPEGPFVVWAGRFIQSKDPRMAARIAERLGLPLVMIGDGPVDIGAAPRVVRLGRLPRPDTLAIIAKSRALLSTSTQEGASTVVREALALGRPVFALRARGIMESAATHLFESEAALVEALESFLDRSV